MERSPRDSPIEIETGSAPDASIIWLHGLGADGHDFEAIASEIGRPATRLILPHAPYRPVTLNQGTVMRAWFDLYALTSGAPQDASGIAAAAAAVQQLVEREQSRGLSPERVVVAGFSQGGAVALHTALASPVRLGGIVGLSTYLPLHDTVNLERTPDHPGIPVFLAHGTWDPVIAISAGERSAELLRGKHLRVDWHSYPMGHTVIPEEISDLRAWLDRVLD
ncbi:MAG: alpha/beta hydrolase [Acidiferrobacteraceae bacterium]